MLYCLILVGKAGHTARNALVALLNFQVSPRPSASVSILIAAEDLVEDTPVDI